MSTSIALAENKFLSSEHLTLEDRILRMAAADNSDLPKFPDDDLSEIPSDIEYISDQEELIEEISESDLLKYLDEQESPLSIAQRLFYHELNTTEYQKQSASWGLKCLTPKCVEDLYGKGWTEIEGIVGLDVLKGAHEEAKALLEQNKFISAKVLKDNDPFRDVKARDDAIVWMDPKNKTKEIGFVQTPPNFKKLLDFINESVHADLSKMIRLKGRTEYQLAYYHPNGAHYERHRDSFPTDDFDDTEQRRVTVIFYLNPGWIYPDGGEIKIYSQKDAHGISVGADRTVKPQLGRVLIFLSGVIDHEVLPSKKPRFALTSWMR